MNESVDDNIVIHNFCESRINNNQPPEIVNAYTSFFITYIPFYLGFPINYYFINVTILFILNGFASYYYHYYLTYLGKQYDEICMIMINYYMLLGLMNIHYNDKHIIQRYHYYNKLFTISFILFNFIQYFDFLFPFLFTLYVLPSLFYIYGITCKNNYKYHYLYISLFGLGCWIISEVYCNEYTYLGHAIWHLTFPLGFYKLMLYYDKKHHINVY